jgi:DUF4097 and DUF4098 domain-containing protein YvlB
MAEYTFHTPEPLDLRLNIPAGELDVETVDGEETSVSVEGSEKIVEAVRVELQGRQLVIEIPGKKPFGITIAFGDFTFGGGSHSLRIRARVPHASRATLQTASADMKLRGRYAEVETNSASGDLVVQGEIEGDARIKTVSGDVRIDRVGRDLRVQSVSGDANVGPVGGSVETKSVSGDVRLDSVREGNVTAQSVSGDIEVGIAPGTNLDVDAGSVSGDLSSEVPLGTDPGSGVGDGPTLVVRGKTVSGDFRVFRAA